MVKFTKAHGIPGCTLLFPNTPRDVEKHFASRGNKLNKVSGAAHYTVVQCYKLAPIIQEKLETEGILAMKADEPTNAADDGDTAVSKTRGSEAGKETRAFQFINKHWEDAFDGFKAIFCHKYSWST